MAETARDSIKEFCETVVLDYERKTGKDGAPLFDILFRHFNDRIKIYTQVTTMSRSEYNKAKLVQDERQIDQFVRYMFLKIAEDKQTPYRVLENLENDKHEIVLQIAIFP